MQKIYFAYLNILFNSANCAPGNFFKAVSNKTKLSVRKISIFLLLFFSCFAFTNASNAQIVSLTSKTDVTCNGGTNGAINIDVSGGVEPYTYAWTGPGVYAATIQDISGLAAGTYTVTVTNDGGGLSAPVSFTIIEPNELSASLIKSNVLCFGNTTGSINLSVAGGTAPYTYVWSNTATTEDLSGLSIGTYNVTVTDANGCTTTASATITQPLTALTASTTKVNVLCFGNTTGSIDLSVTGGTLPYTYVWSNTATTEDLSGLGIGTYNVTVTDANGCTTTASATITQPLTALTASITKVNVLCFGNTTGSINLSVTGGTAPYSFVWSNTATTEDLSGLGIGTYNVTVTDANGCTTTASATITQPAAALAASTTQVNVLCFGNTTGSIDLSVTGGSSPYSFVWSNAATTEDLSGLGIGTYNVTVTDANGCSTTAAVTITQPAAALAASTTKVNVLCFGNTSGSIDLSVTGGTAPYTYLWSNGASTEDLSGLGIGTYNVTVTDANGCSTTAAVTITQPAAALATSTTQVNVLCFGNTSGSVNLSVTGGKAPYTYVWSNASTTEDISGLAAGIYNVTVTDANGCTTTASATITQPEVLTATSSFTAVLCNAGTTGTMTAVPTGGTAPYTYVIAGPTVNTTGATSGVFIGLKAGIYTITVKDAKLCTTTTSQTITEPIVLNATSSFTAVLCNGGATGIMTAATTGGTAPYSYVIAGPTVNITGASTGIFTGLTAGAYIITVTDANGCIKATASKTITQPAVLGATISASTMVLCYGEATGSITVVATGGIAPYTYAIDGPTNTTGDNSGIYTSLAAGTYSITVTDANSCKKIITKDITQPAAALTITTITVNTPCLGTPLNLKSTVAGGKTAYGYTWTGPNGFTSNVQNATIPAVTVAAAGIYTLVVTDANGCTVTSSVTASVNPLPTISLAALPEYCPNTSSFNLAYVGTTEDPTSYSITTGTPTMPGFAAWNNKPLTSSPLTITIPLSKPQGTYQFFITVKNANGCISESQAFEITIKDITPPTISCAADITVSTGTTNCTATVTLIKPSVSDNCWTIPAANITNNAPNPFPLGTTDVTWTAVDGSGNSSTCTQKVTVIDQVNPKAICKTTPPIFSLDATGNATPVLSDIDNGSYDNCSIFKRELSINGDTLKTTFDCSNLGRVNYLGLKITDNSGNSDVCDMIFPSTGILVQNLTAPTAKTKNIDLFLDASGNATILPSDIDDGSFGNCSFQRSINKSTFNCSNLGTNTVTLTLKNWTGSLRSYPSTDSIFNITTKTAVVTVKDNISPVAKCKNITVNLDASGNATILGSTLDNGSTDNCTLPANLIFTVSPSTFNCTMVGNNTVTLTVKDASGNSSTCTATVTVKDLIAPTAICKTTPVTIYLDNAGNAVLTPAMVNNVSSDNCGPVTLSLSKTLFTCSDLGNNTVTLTVKDANGNIATCTSTVTVVDNLPPTASCTASILTLNDASGTVTLNVAAFDNGSTDNCGIVSKLISKDNINFSSSLSFSCSDVGYKQVWLKVTDASGNTSTCSSIMTIKSNLKITLIDVNLCSRQFNSAASGGKAGYTYAWEAISGPTLNIFDAIGNTTSAVFNPSLTSGIPAGNYWVKLTVTDANGCSKVDSLSFYGTINLTGTISTACVSQTTPYNNPTYTTYISTKPPADYTYQWIVNGTPPATVNVDYTIVAGGGNTDNFIKILWKTAGQRNIVVQNNPKGAECVTLEIHVVYVKDNPLPLFESFANPVCPQTIATYTLKSPPTRDATNWVVTNGTITAGGSSLDNYVTVKWGNSTGYVTGTMIQTDAGGNYFCQATTFNQINIIDNTPPTITCPTNITVNANAGQCIATGVNLGLPVAADNCSIQSITNNAPASFPVGVTTITWTVRDFGNGGSGRTATCAQTVTVIDNQFPVITGCPANISQNLIATDGCSKNIITTNPTATDNCSVVSLTWALTGATTVSSSATGINYVGTRSFNIGVTTVTYTATDPSGKTATCSFTVTVLDNILPSITCPANKTVTMDADGCTATNVDLGTPVTSDNCSIASITNNAPAAFPKGATTVTWTVKDGSGNIKTCTQIITVEDNTPPVITCPPSVTGFVDVGRCQVDLYIGVPISSDNCILENVATIPTLSWVMTGATTAASTPGGIKYVDHYVFNLGITRVTYTLRDGAGNTVTCFFDVTVLDNKPPTLTACPTPSSFYTNDAGQSFATLTFTVPTSTDKCSTPVITWSAPGANPASGTGAITGVQFPVGSTTATYSATDAAGNTTSCSFTVVVKGSPVITCPATIVSCDAILDPGYPTIISGTAPISLGWQLTGATTAYGSGLIGIRTFGVGSTTIKWTAVNTAGTATCTQTITVKASNTWLGVTTNWNDPVNWCPTVPTSVSNVTIPVVVSGIYPIIDVTSGMAAVNNILINGASAKLTVTEETLELHGAITATSGSVDVSNGTIEFKGTATQTLYGSMLKNNSIMDLTINNAVGLAVASAKVDSVNILRKLIFKDENADLNTGNNIVLRSTPVATASVGELKTGNDVTGDFIIERYIQKYQSWNMLSAPINKNKTVSVWDSWQEHGAPKVSNGRGTQITSPILGDGIDGPSIGQSLKYYNASSGGYELINDTKAAPINNNEGYYIFVRGDRFYGPGNPGSTTTLRSKGEIYTFATKPSFTFSAAPGSFIALGNPYASAVDLIELQVQNPNLEENFYFWDPTLAGSYGVGGYQNISQSTGYLPTPSSNLYKFDKTYTKMQSGQAIFVKSAASAPNPITISFKENMKKDSSLQFSRGGNQAAEIVMLSTMIYSSNGDLADGNRVVFAENYSNAVDRYDAIKITNGGINFGLLREQKKLIVEARQPMSATDTLFYNMSNLGNGSFKLGFSVQYIPAGNEAYLIDKFLQSRTPISLGDSSYYNFTTTAVAASKAADRFMMVFKPAAGPLPVTITGISANRNNDRSIAIRWTVENEVNIEKYEIERSADGRNFTGIISAAATNSSVYTKNDLSPLAADNFYRIKALTLGGYTQYSAIVKVAPLVELPSIVISPNPVADQRTQIKFVNQTAGIYEIKLINQSGQLMQKEKVKVAGNNFVKTFVLNNNFAGGVYQLDILNPDGSSTVQQLIIK